MYITQDNDAYPLRNVRSFMSKCSKRDVCHHEYLPIRVALVGKYHFSVPESRVFLIGPEAVADETSSLVQTAACSF